MKTRTVLGLVLVIGAGVGVRTLPHRASTNLAAWWPWTSTTVTLYFSDGHFLVPVSRRLPQTVDVPRSTLQVLLAGPSPASRLQSLVPRGLEVRSFELSDSVARIDLSPAALIGDLSHATATEMAIVETMTALPDVKSVSISVDGRPLTDSRQRVPLWYYATANGLVAIPAAASAPRAALTAYLSPSPDSGLIGLPADVRLIDYSENQSTGSLSLNFSYTQSVRALALERPERMRLVLLGLIASLTEFPSVAAVRLDFEGQSRLGLGQCSDLLRTWQPRPELLNDERLLEH
jgi:spore germination protein GerM